MEPHLLVRGLFVAIATSATAFNPAGASPCAEIDNDIARLECYDKQLGEGGPPAQPTFSSEDQHRLIEILHNSNNDTTASLINCVLTVNYDSYNSFWKRREAAHRVIDLGDVDINATGKVTRDELGNYRYRIVAESGETFYFKSTNARYQTTKEEQKRDTSIFFDGRHSKDYDVDAFGVVFKKAVEACKSGHLPLQTSESGQSQAIDAVPEELDLLSKAFYFYEHEPSYNLTQFRSFEFPSGPRTVLPLRHMAAEKLNQRHL